MGLISRIQDLVSGRVHNTLTTIKDMLALVKPSALSVRLEGLIQEMNTMSQNQSDQKQQLDQALEKLGTGLTNLAGEFRSAMDDLNAKIVAQAATPPVQAQAGASAQVDLSSEVQTVNALVARMDEMGQSLKSGDVHAAAQAATGSGNASAGAGASTGATEATVVNPGQGSTGPTPTPETGTQPAPAPTAESGQVSGGMTGQSTTDTAGGKTDGGGSSSSGL